VDDKDLLPIFSEDAVLEMKKSDLSFIVNRFQLGDFKDEIEVDSQEALVNALLSDPSDGYIPKTFNQALKDVNAKDWMAAVQEELSNLADLDVWEVRLVPVGTRVLGARWVFAQKFNDLGAVIRFKARYVAKGYSQVEGDSFWSTFAPTATFTSLRLILTIAVKNDWPVHSFDFVAAYLNSPIEEDVWVEAPKGLDVPKGHACKLKKALYGTKQAARCWWKHLSSILEGMGYQSSQYDSSVYCLSNGDSRNIIWIHVDDGIITGPTLASLQELETNLKSSIKIKWTAGLDNIVGLSLKRTTSGFELRQPNLTAKILRDRWDGVTIAKTPFPTGNLPDTNPDAEGVDSSTYLSIIGSLNYLAVATRPDIAFSVNFLARFSKNPSVLHWSFLNHLINYIGGTSDQALFLSPRKEAPEISCFVDANWGGEFQRSTHGLIVFCFGCPVSWVSKRLATVASSTAHAEYMAMGIGVREVLWIRNLLCDVQGQEFKAQLYCDNQSAIKIASNDTSNKRTRHTERDFYVSNQVFYRGQIELFWVPTKTQFADVFTKNLPPVLHASQSAVILGRIPSSGGVL
jgi:hypothetical protein